MTTASASFAFTPANTASNAQWVAWINGIRDLIAGVGLVQTSDTGQLVVTANSVPNWSGTNPLLGYHTFRFPDALQTSKPIILRVDYRLYSSYYPYVAFTVGDGTDGAGNFIGATFTPGTLTGMNTSTYNTSAVSNYACYVDGTFSCVLGIGINTANTLSANTHMAAVIVDRERNNSGVAQAGGYLCEGTTVANTFSSSRSMYGSNPPATSGMVPALVPSMMAPSTAEGTNVNVFRHYMMTPGVKPSLGSLTYLYGEFGAFTPITVSVLGAQHTYMPMGRALPGWSANAALLAYGGGPGGANTYDYCGMIRWE